MCCVLCVSHVSARHVRIFLPAAVARSAHDHPWLRHAASRDICLEYGGRIAGRIGLFLLLIPAVEPVRECETHVTREISRGEREREC